MIQAQRIQCSRNVQRKVKLNSKPVKRSLISRCFNDIQGMDDWRQFRARMVEKEGFPNMRNARISEDNFNLLNEQNPQLGSEDIWAHPIAQPELGGLLLASPYYSSFQNGFQEAVIALCWHKPNEEAMGLIINRPSSVDISQIGLNRLSSDFQEEGVHTEIFNKNVVYFGGNKARNMLHIMHGHPEMTGSREVCPGVYLGGQEEALRAVSEGVVCPGEFKFFVGAMVWKDGELEKEIAKGYWYPTACSRNQILKQSLQLPTPLWYEIMCLMGGDFRKEAEECYGYTNDGARAKDGDEGSQAR